MPDAAQLALRQQEVLDLITRGFVTKEIADQLQISIPTIKTYIRRIYEKLHVCFGVRSGQISGTLRELRGGLPGSLLGLCHPFG